MPISLYSAINTKRWLSYLFLALKDKLKRVEEERWKKENKAAIAAYNEFVAENGCITQTCLSCLVQTCVSCLVRWIWCISRKPKTKKPALAGVHKHACLFSPLISKLRFQAWQVTPHNQKWRAATVSVRSCDYKYACLISLLLIFIDIYFSNLRHVKVSF